MLEPLKLRPVYKEYIWGGDRLKKEYNKAKAPERTAESWELACHKDGMTTVAEGRYIGKSLQWLGEMDRERFWGRKCHGEHFPIMVKLIDARSALSVQVHPSDLNALPGEHGKAELWYIVDCEPQSFIYFGFSRKIDREEFLARSREGTICQVLNKVPASKGDVFYILPGTVHSIGAGMLIAEVQQNSNTTFRIYDYGRPDTDGKPRPLHIQRAADVISFEPIIPEECRANSSVSFPGFTVTELFGSRYFKTYRLDLRGSAALNCDGESFRHLLCVDGCGKIRTACGEYGFRRGDSYFLPAEMGEYTIEGESRLLLSTL